MEFLLKFVQPASTSSTRLGRLGGRRGVVRINTDIRAACSRVRSAFLCTRGSVSHGKTLAHFVGVHTLERVPQTHSLSMLCERIEKRIGKEHLTPANIE